MIFVNRERELEILNKKLKQFKSGIWLNTSHVAFLGLRRTGKTYLVKYFLEQVKQEEKDIVTIFVDISKLTESIKVFCDTVLQNFARGYVESYEDVDLDMFFHQHFSGKFYSFYRSYFGKKSDFEIFDTFLQFLTLLSKEQKLIIALDEFQDIMNFSKIPGLRNIDNIFRSELQNQENIFYVITGSYPSILRDLIQNPHKKLYSHFDICDIKNFDKKASMELISLFDRNLDGGEKSALYKSCNGNPYLISLILQKVDTSLLGDFEMNVKNLLFDRKGAIYNHYEYILEESLSKIQKSLTLKAILKEISFHNNGCTLTEISKKTGHSPQQISFGLRQLLKVDIIYQNSEKRWKFQDLLFSYFIAYSLGGIENYEFEQNDYYKTEVQKLQENLQRTLTELGRAKEFELFYEVKVSQGEMWRGVKLPRFKTLKKNYFTGVGDEIDLYGETAGGKKWLFELKYKNKKVGLKAIKKFLAKQEADKYVFISKSGFVENILEKYEADKKLFLVHLKS